jgi:hypothetical protein
MGAWNVSLLKIDMNTGIVVDTVFTQDSVNTGDTTVNWIGGDINRPFYNCVDDHIYFFYKTRHKKVDNSPVIGNRLAKIDAITGKVSLVYIFPLETYGGQQHFGKTQQKILVNQNLNVNEILLYDLQTQKLTSVLLSRNYDRNRYANLIMSTADNQLYGYEVDYGPVGTAVPVCKMIKADPITGLITDLSEPFSSYIMGDMCFGPGSQKIFFTELPGNSTYQRWSSFDIQTKKHAVILQENGTPGMHLWSNMYLGDDTDVDTAFTCKINCRNLPTEFYPTTRIGSIEWDFGDPASGSLNTSNQTYPKHIYSKAGTYTVKMVSSNCWRSQTTTKTIEIGSLPKIDLGNDITWCLHKKHEDVHLFMNAPGATYLWQDLTTADNYTVNTPGLYWVKVTNSTCELTDSLSVRELPCSCDITVSPTYTHTTVSFNFDCDLAAYNSLMLELYNNTGQIVQRKNIVESNTIVNVEQFAAGVYFYRIRDNQGILKSGKVIFVR